MIRVIGLILAIALGTGCTAEMDNNEVDRDAIFDSCNVEVEEYIENTYMGHPDDTIKIVNDVENNKVKVTYLVSGTYHEYEGAKEQYRETVEEMDLTGMYKECVDGIQDIYEHKGLDDVTVSLNLVNENGEVMLFVDTEGNSSVWPD